VIVVNGARFTDRQVFLLHAAVKSYFFKLLRCVHDETRTNGCRSAAAAKAREAEIVMDLVATALPEGTVR
jgi:hypothetical protein